VHADAVAGPQEEEPALADPFAIDEAAEAAPPPETEEPRAATPVAPSPPRPLAPSSDAPGLAAIQGRWSVVVEELKRRKAVNTNALLADAKPVRLDGETLVVGFRYSPLMERFQQKKENQQHLEAALQAVFGAPYRIHAELLRDEGDGSGEGGGAPRGEMLPRAASTPPSTAARATPSAAEGETPSADRLIHEVIAIFNGKILEE
jgi:hypothetical protein